MQSDLKETQDDNRDMQNDYKNTNTTMRQIMSAKRHKTSMKTQNGYKDDYKKTENNNKET